MFSFKEMCMIMPYTDIQSFRLALNVLISRIKKYLVDNHVPNPLYYEVIPSVNGLVEVNYIWILLLKCFPYKVYISLSGKLFA